MRILLTKKSPGTVAGARSKEWEVNEGDG